MHGYGSFSDAIALDPALSGYLLFIFFSERRSSNSSSRLELASQAEAWSQALCARPIVLLPRAARILHYSHLSHQLSAVEVHTHFIPQLPREVW